MHHNTTQCDFDRRCEERQMMCARVELWVLDQPRPKRFVSDAVTRNSSFRGVALVARLEEPVRCGQGVEVVLISSTLLREHLAGTVAFCRSLASPYYEIGVNVKAAGRHWILADNLAGAQSRYDWFASAAACG